MTFCSNCGFDFEGKACDSWKCVKGMPLIADGDTATRGYAGFNHGLDVEVKNKGEWKQVAKEKGLRPVDGW